MFCWACGSLVGPAIGPPCPVCGVGRDLPSWDSGSPIGRRVEYRVRLSRRSAVVVATDSTSAIVTDGRSDAHIPLSKIVFTDAGVWPSAWYRLHCAGLADRLGPVSLGDRRAFAGCAVAARDLDGVGASGLGPREQAWLRMWLRHNAGDRSGALAEAVALGPVTYPDRLGVFAAALDDWVADASIRGLVFQLANSFPTDQLAQLLLAVLADPMPDVAAPVQACVSSVAPGLAATDSTRTIAAAIRSGRSLAVATGSRYVSSATLRTVAICDAPPGSPLPDLAEVEMSVLDDAVDSGVLTLPLLESCGASLADGARLYLTARLDPGGLTDDQVAALGHRDEAHRRSFVAPGRAPVPPGEPGGRYDLLTRLRDGDQRVVGDLVPMLPAEHAPVAIAVGASLHTGRLHLEAVADPSTWDVLVPVFVRELQDDPAGMEATARDAAGWALLDLAKRELFDWRWPQAVWAASGCMAAVDDEPRSDEATAIKAAAALMNGDRDLAVGYLDDAATGEASDSLLVNLALLAADESPELAADALVRLARQTKDRRLAARAVVRAAHLYLRDDGDWTPTSDHRRMLRRACGADLELGEHLEVMAVAAGVDSEWVSDPVNTADTPHSQTIEHRLAVAKAADSVDSLLDLLTAASANGETPDVVEREVARLVSTSLAMMAESEEPSVVAGLVALDLFDRNLPVEPGMAVILRAFAVQELCWYVADLEEMSPPLADWQAHLDAAAAGLVRVPPEDLDSAQEVVDDARKVMARAWSLHWFRRRAGIVAHHQQTLEQYRDRMASVRSNQEVAGVNRVMHGILSELLEATVALRSEIDARIATVVQVDDLRDVVVGLRQSVIEIEVVLRRHLR